MSRRPQVVRNMRLRSFGSRTRIRDEVRIPATLYHGGRLAAWASRHWRGAGGFLLVVLLWSASGSLALALVVSLVLIVGGWTAWVGLRQSATEGGALSLREALLEARQKQTLRKRWDLACETAGLTGARHGEPPALRRVKGNGRGTLTAVVRSGEIGVPVPSIVKAVGTLSEVIGCREVVVNQVAPGVAELAFHWADPLSRVLTLTDLPPAPSGRLAYGIRQDGGVASIKLDRSVLIGGLTGMGKSNIVWGLLGDAIRQGIPVHLYVSDPKGGVELDAFEAMAGKEPMGLVKVRQYAKTAAETVKMIEVVEKAMHKRQEEMKATGTRQIEPSRENPLVVLILDETLPLSSLLRQGTDSALGRIAYTGRAAAYVVWANTQVGQIDALGRFRDLLPQRLCFGTPNPQVTDSVLGAGAEASGAKCSEIQDPGVGFSYIEGERQARKFRGVLVSDEETRAIAAGCLPKEVTDHYSALLDGGGSATDSGEREPRSRQRALYRWFGADDPPGSRPAYIGTSYDVLIREAEHNMALREFMQGNIRREVEWFPNRRAADRAEVEAIRTEHPRFNIQHNRDWRVPERKRAGV